MKLRIAAQVFCSATLTVVRVDVIGAFLVERPS